MEKLSKINKCRDIFIPDSRVWELFGMTNIYVIFGSVGLKVTKSEDEDEDDKLFLWKLANRATFRANFLTLLTKNNLYLDVASQVE